MKRAYRTSQYAKPGEQYCRETYPDEAASILQKAEEYYLVFLKDMPDLGKNMMAKNMLDWFTILAFYEASGHRMDGKTLLTIKRRAVDRMKFLGKLVDGNRQQCPYKLFEKNVPELHSHAGGASGKGRMAGQPEDPAEPRPPHRGLLLPPRGLPHRQARQGARLRRAAALPLQN